MLSNESIKNKESCYGNNHNHNNEYSDSRE